MWYGMDWNCIWISIVFRMWTLFNFNERVNLRELIKVEFSMQMTFTINFNFITLFHQPVRSSTSAERGNCDSDSWLIDTVDASRGLF